MEFALTQLWKKRTQDGRLIKVIDENTGGVYGVSFSKNGKYIAKERLFTSKRLS
ncbi:hypothetical protein CAL7716_089700 [Calothrix sp. PCC 7716]|nr:hypothetical protein CAL7716_089700 [Calothrix sp. PCC 7716]